jgi:DNA-3-methyladenine glycosylase
MDLSFLAEDSPTAAPRLLGAVLTSRVGGETVSVRLNEVEAYLGEEDTASHAYRSRTARNEPMYGQPGTIYVYRSYGIHWCMNLVTGRLNDPQAVLLRGGTVIAGRDTAITRRGRSTDLANGPGKLAQALGVTGVESGSTLGAGRISISSVATSPPFHVATSRVGISHGRDRLWRFVEVKGTK